MTSRIVRSLRALLSGMAIAGFAAFAPASHAADTIKIGTVVWIGYGPYYVAEALDLYTKSGVKVELQVFTDPALIPPAIESGAVDGGMLTYDQVIGVVAKGSTQRVVAPIDYSNGGDAIVATKDITKVAQFKGKLFLATGDMDDNVHPANTMRVVDALIKHNKPFDLLVVPNAGHEVGSEHPYLIRRQWDFFVTHLLGATPPANYVISTPGKDQ